MDFPVKTPLQLRPLLVGFRKAAGLTQAQVASRLGMAQQTYAQIEAKPEATSLHRLYHVLKIFDVDIVLTQVPNAIHSAAPPVEHAPTVALSIDPLHNAAKKHTVPAANKRARTRKGEATSATASEKPAIKSAHLKSVLKKRENW